MSTAHPYVRISHPEQRKGGGIRRQTAEAVRPISDFCRDHGFRVAARLLIDDGVSAFRGLNATPTHELGQFLQRAKDGAIPRGDCLLIENWDRLSRQDVWAAVGLVHDLRELGIHVGRLDRMKLLRCDSTDAGDFFEAAVELMRGNSESAAKSDRNGKAWKRKRAAARESRRVITRMLPAWVRLDGDRLALIPERAAAVRRIFALARSGYGLKRIAQTLTAEGVEPFGEVVVREGRKRSQFAGRWSVPYLALILRDRRALGELQPKGPGRKPEGDPIPDYYPRVVSDQDFWAAKDVRANRPQSRATRRGKHADIFAGLLIDARSGSAYMAAQKDGKNKSNRVLVTHASTEGRGPCWSFPVATFEAAVLTLLKEISPADVLPGDDRPDETAALESERAVVREEITAIAEDMARRYSKTLAAVLERKEVRLAELDAQLSTAKAEAARPAAEAWGDMLTLADLLATAEDPVDVRLRLRLAVRRNVEGARLLVVPRGRDRFCAAQFAFSGGVVRRFLILHVAAGKNRPGDWEAWSFASAGVSDSFDLDIADDVGRLVGVLEALDVDVIRGK